jgi:hypothetical protein
MKSQVSQSGIETIWQKQGAELIYETDEIPHGSEG